MFNVGGGEILVILVLGLIVLGPDKLPETARAIGKHLSTFKRMRDGFQNELRSAMDPLHDVVATVTKPNATNSAPEPTPGPVSLGASPTDRRNADLLHVAGPSDSFR